MSWMRWTRTFGLCVALLLIMTLVAACGGDDDDSDDSSPVSQGSGTVATDSGASAATGTPDANQPGTPAATAPAPQNTPSDEEAEVEDASATTTESSAEATVSVTAPSTTGTGDATTTTTTTTGGSEASATGTGSGTGSTGDLPEECETALEDVESLDPDLIPNFSVRFDIATGGDSGEEEIGAITIVLNQSEPGTYYSSMETEGTAMESWVIGDQAWNDFGTGVMESDPSATIFTPDTLLSQMTEGLRQFYGAADEGSEEVNGRETTLYTISGEDFAESYNKCAGDDMTIDEASGELQYWIDDEWDIMIKGEGTMEWTYSDGTTTTFEYSQEIFDIGTTADIQPPA